MYYIQRKDSQYLETVDQFESRKEANEMLQEYRMSDSSAHYYISTRACADWRKDAEGSKEQAVIDAALKILESRIQYATDTVITCPRDSADYLRLKLQDKKHEVFVCVFLDNRHKVIATDDMFNGTIDSASVYPREVVKRALEHNAAAVVLSHNHPSGNIEPSAADKQITNRLRDALQLIDVRVLDHVVIGNGFYSFAENGLI